MISSVVLIYVLLSCIAALSLAFVTNLSYRRYLAEDDRLVEEEERRDGDVAVVSNEVRVENEPRIGFSMKAGYTRLKLPYSWMGLGFFTLFLLAALCGWLLAQPSLRSFLTGLVLLTSMLLGMIAKTVWDAIDKRREGAKVKVDLWAMVKPLLVSPIVFMAVFTQSQHQNPLDILTVCFAFQNGFAWQTVLGSSAVSTRGRPAVEESPPVPGAAAGQ